MEVGRNQTVPLGVPQWDGVGVEAVAMHLVLAELLCGVVPAAVLLAELQYMVEMVELVLAREFSLVVAAAQVAEQVELEW